MVGNDTVCKGNLARASSPLPGPLLKERESWLMVWVILLHLERFRLQVVCVELFTNS